MASVDRRDTGEVYITSGNLAAVNAYEPGSVAKVITIAAGLNQGTVTPDSTFVVPWRRQFADDLLSDSHQHPDELMSVERILVESSNIGTIDVQMSIGSGDWDPARQTHWEYMRRFGLGEKTALDFPGESPGILKHWSDLWGSERVTVAYGQGVASTSIQLVSAINAIANDGTYVAPRLVAGLRRRRGQHHRRRAVGDPRGRHACRGRRSAADDAGRGLRRAAAPVSSPSRGSSTSTSPARPEPA